MTNIKRTLFASFSIIFLLSLGGIFPQVISLQYSNAQTDTSLFPTITSYRVSGAPNYSNPGGESFWSAINWTNVPLAASVSPGGGHTQNVLVKSANDGYQIYVLFRWNDTQGPSYMSQDEVFKLPNGSLALLEDADTANVTQLFYNSTYYYPDRAAILWYTGNTSQQQQSPKMALGTDGALTGGSAEIWHWQSNPTDNNPNDTGFPGGYTDPNGNPVYPTNNLSFAEDDYTNMSGFFVVAGSFGANASNLAPYANPFIIKVGSVYSYTNKTWTVEMVRDFTSPDASQYRVQLATGSTYYTAFAIWQGKLGESADFKSVSQWYALTVSGSSPPTTTTTSTSAQGGISFELSTAVGVSALIVGLAIGILLRQPSAKKTKAGAA